MLEKDPRSTADKVRLFRTWFSGLEHVHGTYDPDSGRSWQVKQPVTDAIVLNHLTGKKPLGTYLLMGTQTRALVVDYDTDEPDYPIEFVNAAVHYGIDGYIEVSKAKGFHVWIFFDPEGVPAIKARAVAKHILDETGHNAEVFPKQDMIDLSRDEYGNFINLPLFGRLVMEGRTVFVDPRNGLRPVPNQWEHLEAVNPVAESLLDEIIEVNEIEVGEGKNSRSPSVLGTFQPARTLPPCARRMLEGVTENQRVSCFRLAVHLRKVGLPYDLAVAALSEWSRKNRPVDGKRIITHCEIKAQVASAFLKEEYRGCGCEEPAVQQFCEPSCPIFPRKQVTKEKST